MSEPYIGIDTSNFTVGQSVTFTTLCAQLITNGIGSITMLSKMMPIKESDGLKVLLGVPESSLTLQQKRLFEGVLSFMRDKPVDKNENVWTTSQFLKPINEAHDNSFPLSECKLDLEFIDEFGLRRAVWEKEIFFTKFAEILNEVKLKQTRNLRVYSALVMFGFDDPMQFFIPA